MTKEVTRYVKREVERELWARAGGRCQFSGCNRLLYKSRVTQEPVNVSEKAHIYSFSLAGPRGWGPFVANRRQLNEAENLMLTRRGIAGSLEWPNLLAAYSDRHSFSIDDLIARDDEFADLFVSIESLATTYRAGKYGEFLSLCADCGKRLESHGHKQKVADEMAELNRLRETSSIGGVIDYALEIGLAQKPKRLQTLEDRVAAGAKPEATEKDKERIERDRQFMASVRGVPYAEVVQLERYLNDETPFSTNHGVKGEEYDNVLVVLDDRQWNQYKFESVLAGDTAKSQYARSLNLFYVSCSRARKRLLVLALSPMGSKAIDGAKRIFGEGQVIPSSQFD